jgi:hypothetical protein
VDAAVSALSDYPDFVPVVARWHWQEWGHTDPGGTLRSWTSGLAQQAGADQISGTASELRCRPSGADRNAPARGAVLEA